MGTFGEGRTLDILCRLPEKEFQCFQEPRIDGPIGTIRYPDFLVVWRSKGVLAVEVKDYKKINIENSNQREIEVVKNWGEIKNFENPFRVAEKYSYNIRELFERRREFLEIHGRIDKLIFPVEGIVIMPNLDQKQVDALVEAKIFPLNRVLPGNALQDEDLLITYLNKITWTWGLKKPLTNEIIETIAYSIKQNSVNSNGIKLGDLTQKQDDIVHRTLPFQDGSYIAELVRGSVGCGKTIVLTKRAEWLINMMPELKILVLAFNIDLTNDLRSKIQNKQIKVLNFFDLCKEILGESWPKRQVYRGQPGPGTIKKWVENNADLISGENLAIDTVALEISRRKDINLISDDQYKEDLNTRKSNLNKKQIDIICIMYDLYFRYQDDLKKDGLDSADFEDIQNLAYEALFGHKLKRSFDVIMIDEAQDWAPKWIQIIKQLLKPGGYIFLCDDPAQSLWRFFNWEQKGIKSIRPINLELPQRTSKEIMDCAQCLFDIEEKLHANYDTDVYPVKTAHLTRGEKPKIIVYKTLENEINKMPILIKNLLDKKLTKIGILCPGFENKKEWENLLIVKDNNVYIGHFNLPKGLEFDAVIIPHLDQIFSENSSQDQSNELSNMRKLFVAMTRAKKELIFTVSQKFPTKLSHLIDYCDVDFQS